MYAGLSLELFMHPLLVLFTWQKPFLEKKMVISCRALHDKIFVRFCSGSAVFQKRAPVHSKLKPLFSSRLDNPYRVSRIPNTTSLSF